MEMNCKNNVLNSPLECIYPQRCIVGDHFEVWRFPYVKDGILEEEPDFVLVLLKGTKNYLHIFTGYQERTQDQDYLARIIWLIHDISEEFDTECHVIENWDVWDPTDHIAEFESLAKKFFEN